MSKPQRQAILKEIAQDIPYPISAYPARDVDPLVFRNGWHEPEPTQIGSTSLAELNLPVPSNCHGLNCAARLAMRVFGASQVRPVTVIVQTEESETNWRTEPVVSDPSSFQIDVPLGSSPTSWQLITIEVPQAVSPLELQGAPDARVLGVSLQGIELVRP